jgi:hypothetical protein
MNEERKEEDMKMSERRQIMMVFFVKHETDKSQFNYLKPEIYRKAQQKVKKINISIFPLIY